MSHFRENAVPQHRQEHTVLSEANGRDPVPTSKTHKFFRSGFESVQAKLDPMIRSHLNVYIWLSRLSFIFTIVGGIVSLVYIDLHQKEISRLTNRIDALESSHLVYNGNGVSVSSTPIAVGFGVPSSVCDTYTSDYLICALGSIRATNSVLAGSITAISQIQTNNGLFLGTVTIQGTQTIQSDSRVQGSVSVGDRVTASNVASLVDDRVKDPTSITATSGSAALDCLMALTVQSYDFAVTGQTTWSDAARKTGFNSTILSTASACAPFSLTRSGINTKNIPGIDNLMTSTFVHASHDDFLALIVAAVQEIARATSVHV